MGSYNPYAVPSWCSGTTNATIGQRAQANSEYDIPKRTYGEELKMYTYTDRTTATEAEPAINKGTGILKGNNKARFTQQTNMVILCLIIKLLRFKCD